MFATTITTTPHNSAIPMTTATTLNRSKADAENFVNGMVSALFLVGTDFGGSLGDWRRIRLIAPRGTVDIITVSTHG